MNPVLIKRLVRRVGIATATVVILAVTALLWDGLHDDIGHADLGLVLGNTVNPDGTASPRLAARLDRTLELYQQGLFPRILVSGALGREGHDEAVFMRDCLVSRGVPAAQVSVDSAGYTTFATARNTRSFMHKNRLGSVLVVSQYFHITRTRFALKQFGVHPVYSAHARHFELRDLYSIPRELVGLAGYAFKEYPDLSPIQEPPAS